MKKIIIGINATDTGSTGSIMCNCLEYAANHADFDYLAIVPYTNREDKRFFGFQYRFCIFKRFLYHHVFKIQKVFPDGFLYREYTRRIIKKIKKSSRGYQKVIIHLHNIHGCGISFPMLFKFLSKRNFKVIYTLHDCWSFTGGCYYYNYLSCFKWQNGCNPICPYRKSKKIFSSKFILKEKAKYTSLFSVDNLLFVPVSFWLDSELKKSFLKSYRSIVVHGECSFEGQVNRKPNLKKELNLVDKKIVISVSAYWNEWKGYKYLYQVADLLPNNYCLLVVGGSFDTMNHKNIIHISNASNSEVRDYLSISDCFVSVTQDDNLPLVLMEAQICGVPIVGFGHGGTCEEVIEGKTGTMVGRENNVEKLVHEIIRVVETNPYLKKDIEEWGNTFRKFEHAKKMLQIYVDE